MTISSPEEDEHLGVSLHPIGPECSNGLRDFKFWLTPFNELFSWPKWSLPALESQAPELYDHLV
jgi:hypothetical protein